MPGDYSGWLTVFADASASHAHVKPASRRAGYGGWHIYDGRSTFVSGKLRWSKRTHTLELAALAATLSHAVRMHRPPPETKISMQSDSLMALRLVARLPGVVTSRGSDVPIVAACNAAKPDEYQALADVMHIMQEGGFALFVKHVRGHQDGRHGRSRINIKCDSLARQAAYGAA